MLGKPVALAPEPGGPQVVGQVSGAAEAFGIHDGMRLGEALSRCPGLGLVPPDGERAAESWERSLALLEGIGAAVESVRPGEAFFELDGLRALWGKPEGVLSRARRRLERPARLGAGPTRLCAYAAALGARPRRGPVIVPAGAARAFLASRPVGVLRERLEGDWERAGLPDTLERLGVETLGELAALPAADLRARLGVQGPVWQAIARGEDVRPLVPTRPEERFESSLELEWPIEGLEPLSFVLTRLLEPLSSRLERRDRGAAVLHVHLRLVTRAGAGSPCDVHVRRLQLPSPLRDVRTLRTLALLDLESNPPPAAVDGVTITVDPTPGRVLQHTLFTRAVPTPEQISTLLARLTAMLGEDRIGTPATVDSYRPGLFEMKPFATEHETARRQTGGEADGRACVVSALRRCRQPVPARVAVDPEARPVRVTTDRRGFVGGAVVLVSGPWRTSGGWWTAGETGTAAGRSLHQTWNRDEWEVVLNDGAIYRIFRDRHTEGWFVDAIVD